jgi:cysteine desulfurase
VAHLTGNFTSESPLSPAVREAISAAFEQGWADPKKLSQAAGRAAILAESAKSEIAQALHTSTADLEILGEPNLSHFIAIGGFLSDTAQLITSTVDLGKIRAIARSHSKDSILQGVDHHGAILRDGLRLKSNSVFSLQATNGETGVLQDIDHWRGSSGKVVIDATRALPAGDMVTGFSATTFEAQSWGGPTGIGFIAIADGKNFRYPLPHIAPIRVPGSYSLPLLIGSAIALEEFKKDMDLLPQLRMSLAKKLSEIAGVTVLGIEGPAASRYLSAIVEDFASEEIVRALLRRNISVDAGSACSPEDLTPSHVIASMGFPTTGHLRFTLHLGMQDEDLNILVSALSEELNQLRR